MTSDQQVGRRPSSAAFSQLAHVFQRPSPAFWEAGS